MAMPARVGKRGRTVIPGIAVDVSIPGVEAVVAGPGATIAPTRIVQPGSDVPVPIPVVRIEVRCLRRRARCRESARGNQSPEYQTLHAGDRSHRRAHCFLFGFYLVFYLL